MIPLVLHPPAQRARRAAVALSTVAIAFSLGCGFFLRRWWAKAPPGSWSDFGGAAMLWLMAALVLLLIAMLLRIGAGLCELLWLERTWANLPASFRKVGPIDDVTPVHVFGLAFIPIVAWFWKLALVATVAKSLEEVRKEAPFAAPVPRRLGLTAVVLGWLPPLNLYLAPFLWELFARKIDVVYLELAARRAPPDA